MKPLFLSLGLIVGLSTSAAGQTMPTVALDFLDADDNVQVTREEMAAQMDLFYDPMDTNGSGALEFFEVEAFMSREIFDAADANGSGTISRSEYRDQVLRDFESADVDGDGVLD